MTGVSATLAMQRQTTDHAHGTQTHRKNDPATRFRHDIQRRICDNKLSSLRRMNAIPEQIRGWAATHGSAGAREIPSPTLVGHVR